jgi:hypothetical protein
VTKSLCDKTGILLGIKGYVFGETTVLILSPYDRLVGLVVNQE